jgi:hypothetical protein
MRLLQFGHLGVDGCRDNFARDSRTGGERAFESCAEPAAEGLGVADGTPDARERRLQYNLFLDSVGIHTQASLD